MAINLGLANDYNVFVFGNLTMGNTDAEGRVAVGGNATLSNYGVGAGIIPLPPVNTDPSFVVGGDVNVTAGSNACGNTVVNPASNVISYTMGNPNGQFIVGSPIDFAAAEQYLNALEKAEYPENLRPVMIHAQLLAEDQLDKVKNLGVIPSFFVAHVYHWGDTHIENFGMERAQNISCAGSALKKGITFTFHQDTPVIMPDMIETIWCAVNRKTKGGVTLGENQKIPVYEALKAVTKNAAYQYFEEKDKGTIEKGKKADLVILSGNILECSDIRSISVLETIKEGKTIYRR